MASMYPMSIKRNVVSPIRNKQEPPMGSQLRREDRPFFSRILPPYLYISHVTDRVKNIICVKRYRAIFPYGMEWHRVRLCDALFLAHLAGRL